MSMAFMVAAASRNRDNRGRYAEDGNDRRMENAEGNYSRMNEDPEMRRSRDSRGRYMEGEGSRMEYAEGNYSRMNDEPEMRRRRDSRGRYMEGEGSRMEYAEGNYSRMDDEPEMRRRRDSRGRYMEGESNARYMPWQEPHIPPYLDKPGMTEKPDGQNPYGGEPEVYRRQKEEQTNMRRMEGEKTSAGEIDYSRPDGGYGNVRYFMHKTDPLNQNDGKEHFQQPRQIGFQQDGEDGLDKETVMHWVEEMEDEAGVKGGKYTWHQAQQYAMNMGITGHQRMLEFYWAMNAMYADYQKAGKKFGVDKPEFYACLAKLFLEDPDAVDNKVKMYAKYVVKHEN